MKASGLVLTEEKAVEFWEINTESSPGYLRLKIEIFCCYYNQLNVL